MYLSVGGRRVMPSHVSRYLSCQRVLELDVESPHSSGSLFTSDGRMLGFDLNANGGHRPTVRKGSKKCEVFCSEDGI